MNQIDTQKEKNGGAISFETKIEQQLNLSVSASAWVVKQWPKFHLLCLEA